MARLANLPAQDIIDTFKGTLDYYVHRGIPCVRSWPRPPTGPRSPAVQEQYELWGHASRVWADQDETLHDAQRHMTTGGTMSGRDLSAVLFLNATTMYPQMLDAEGTSPPPSWLKD